jgi:transposase InsO family protein
VEDKSRLPVRRKCHLAEMPRSTYYVSQDRPESKRERRNRYLLVLIKETDIQSRHTYGSRRMYAELHKRHIRCSINRIARLMKEHGVVAVQRRKYRPTTDSKHDFPVAPNRLGRNFEAKQRNRVWVADITYIPTDEGWLYLATELDLHSHRIVGWSLSSRISRQLVLDALNLAVGLRRPGLVVELAAFLVVTLVFGDIGELVQRFGDAGLVA